jgi:MFS family permease
VQSLNVGAAQPSNEAAPGPKAPASAWYALAVLIGTTLFAFVDRQILTLITPQLQAMLKLSDLQLGALTGLGMAVFASLGAYPIGWLADKFGRRLVLGCCVVVWSLSAAACAFQNTFEGVFAATVGIAIAEAALSPIIFAIIPGLFPERQRVTANLIFFGAVLFGAAAGFGLGGVTLTWLTSHQQSLPGALAAMDSWRVALLLVAAPAPVFVLMLLTLRLKDDSSRVTAAAEQKPKADPFFPFLRENWRMFSCLCVAMAGYGLPLASAFTWLPIAMPRIFGTKPETIGLSLGIAVGVATVVGLALPAVSGKLLRRDLAVNPMAAACVFAGLGFLPTLLMLFASAPWQIYTAAGAQMALALATAALMPGVLQQIVPTRMLSRLMALQAITTVVPQGLAPILIGAVSGMIAGPRGILTAVVLISLPGWLIAAYFMWRAERRFAATVASAKALG